MPFQQRTSFQFRKFFSELGIPIAKEKTMGPATSIEFLGINLDSVKFQVSLPKEKSDRIILVASTLSDNLECSKRKLLSLPGYLNFAICIIPQDRSHISSASNFHNSGMSRWTLIMDNIP